ncbi:DivIVA domain-containing protein [Dactylosporangium siamense]|uniref:DivIVA domain-containing protein n=1 Tax=Dactylosporangium siamense TaxID=685454 RepID=A0A919PKI9_9ACTN|nr:DivIVA domain-containing protein [Dactylosporangium siamense]GIG43853.1 hypothetical protein Dsi01nite_018940 [Dactylosporangium siamense]
MIPFEFAVVLRGYDPRAVDALLAPAAEALTTTDERARAAAVDALRGANLPVVLRGFDRGQVAGAIARLTAQLQDGSLADPTPVEFAVVLRGYDITAVDDLVEQVGGALQSGSATARAEAADVVREAVFAVKFRGYARHEVDRFLQQAARDLA